MRGRSSSWDRSYTVRSFLRRSSSDRRSRSSSSDDAVAQARSLLVKVVNITLGERCGGNLAQEISAVPDLPGVAPLLSALTALCQALDVYAVFLKSSEDLSADRLLDLLDHIDALDVPQLGCATLVVAEVLQHRAHGTVAEQRSVIKGIEECAHGGIPSQPDASPLLTGRDSDHVTEGCCRGRRAHRVCRAVRARPWCGSDPAQAPHPPHPSQWHG